MPRVLVVANDFPYPPHHGAAVDMWNRISILRRMGFVLDLIATVRNYPGQEAIAIVQSMVDHLWIVERKTGISAALSFLPYQVRSRRALRDIALSEIYDAVLLQTEYTALVLENVHLDAGIRILRVDNDEARYFGELSKSAASWVARCFYRMESLKFARFSRRVKSKCDLLWFASAWERTDHSRRHPDDSVKAIFLPPDPGVKGMRPYSGNGMKALYIGSLTIPLNLEGLEWYFEHVHGRLSEIPGYSLTIAGRTGGASLPPVTKMVRRYSNVTLCPDPQELTDLYASAAVFINPVLRGAGIKVKTIHALHAGLPVVSTSIGMEGTGLVNGSHLLVADSAVDFSSSVATLLQDRLLASKLVQSAQLFLAEAYDHERNLRKSLAAVLSTLPAVVGKLDAKNEKLGGQVGQASAPEMSKMGVEGSI